MYLSKSLVVLSLLAFVFSQTNPVPFSQSVVGQAGNGTIYFQSDVGSFQSWKNVVNPVTLSIIFQSGSSNVFNTSVCVNHMEESYPISGPSIATNCPRGGFGIVTSDNTVNFDGPKIGKTYSPFNVTKNADLYLKPTDGGAFIADIPDSVDLTNFQMTISGMYCEDEGMYPIGQDNMCVEVITMNINETQSVNISSSMDKYFAIDVPSSGSQINSLVIYVDSGVVPTIQEGYFPEPNWYIPTDFLPVDQDDDNDDDKYTSGSRMRAEIMTPGFFVGQTQTFYLRLSSSDSTSKMINVQTTPTMCDDGFFGMGCGHGPSQIDDPVDGVMLISSTLSGVPSVTPTPTPSSNAPFVPVETQNNNAKVFKYDYSDDDYDGDYAYFSIDNYPDLPTPFWIRVSVANNGNDMAPPLYAKQGGYPSMHSNHYNASTDNDVVHQIAVKIEDTDLTRTAETTWYFAVPLPNDFAIWVGTNCANNCNDTASVCMCNGDVCPKQVDAYGAYQNSAVFYKKVTNNMDSGGACVCDNDEYSDSYDCSIRTHPDLWLLIGVVSAVLGCCCCCILLLPCAFFVMSSQKKEDEFEFETLE